ncbi:MAG: hypothetical protein JO170_16010 [Verrucomicrobia bacterium]|nr:hypothetical protein [Verrucomicrobiota bacterium]
MESKPVLSVDAISSICSSSPIVDSASDGTLASGMGVGAAFAGDGDDDGASAARMGGLPASKIKASKVAARIKGLGEERMNNDK